MIGGTIWANFAIQAMTLVTSVATARMLGTVGRGELALVLLYPQLVAGIAFLGVDRAVAILGGRGDLHHPQITIIKLVLLFSIPAIVAGYITVVWRIEDSHLAGLGTTYLAYVPALYFFTLAVSLFNGIGDFFRFNLARLWFYGCNLFLLLAVWGVAPETFLDWIVLANLTSAYGAFAMAALVMWGRVRREGTHVLSVTHGDVRAVLSLSFVFALPVMLGNFSNSAYQILLEHWMGVQPLGLFVVYFSYSRLLAPLGSAIGSHAFHVGIVGENLNMARAFRQGLLVYFVCIVPLWLVAERLIPLAFGRGFVVDIDAVAFLMVSCLFALLADNVAEFLKGQRKVGADTAGRLIYLATFGILGWGLVPALGLFGLALAMALGDALRCVYLVRQVSRETKQRTSEFWLITWRDFCDLKPIAKKKLQTFLASA